RKRGTKEARPGKEPKGGDAIAASDDDESDPNARKKRELTGVFVLIGDHAEFRKIKTGISSETDIQVLPGGELKAGERVVTGPYKVLRDLKPGDRVEWQKKGKGAANGPQRAGG